MPLWRRAIERAGLTVAGSFVLPTQDPVAECSQSVILCEAPGSEARAEEEKSAVIGHAVAQDILTLLGDERSSAYSARRPLMEMGLDSIELVELKSLMTGRFGVKLPPAFLFEHPTQEKIADALAATISDEQVRASLPREPPSPAADPATGDAIAVVGVACRFAGGASSPEAFWKLLADGEHGIAPMPEGRWRWPSFIELEGRHRGIDQAGFLERVDTFDARFFRIAPKEAELMDPQQRLLLELSWEALEDAGHRPSELAGCKVGVFVGVCQSDYRDVLVAACDSAEGYVGSGTAFAMLSNRLSYFYDFKGPSLTVDTACSSSLFALHDAVNALRRGECEQALVGAANVLCSPTISVSYHEAGMLSPTGRCRTFDATADGYVRGEGGAVLLLKPLARAIADGDAVYGLVKGTAVNHGGQASTLTAPKPDAQAEVVETAWREAGAAPDTVGYIEAHGTGTPLGDPIEISGLTEAFRRLYRSAGKSLPPQRHCGLGSVKSNVGHLEGAAGLAGLIKILLSMSHRQIPRTLHFRRLNPEIDLGGGPFYIVERNQDWPRFRDEQGRELPRRAGVSSFGFGGANSHAVIEEYQRPAPEPAEAVEEGPCLVPLSARTREALIERARRLLDFVEGLVRRDAPGPAGSPVDGALNDLRTLLRNRFGLDECTPDLEWEDLGWGAVETRFFLAALEETRGLRLHSRALVEHPSLGSLAAAIARDPRGPRKPSAAAGPAETVPLRDLAYTLQVGREPMAERVAFVARSLEELAGALRGFVAGGAPPVPASAPGELARLGARWAEGGEIDWARLSPGVRPRRIHLPAYPFARERHWVGARGRTRPVSPISPVEPLLAALREGRLDGRQLAEIAAALQAAQGQPPRRAGLSWSPGALVTAGEGPGHHFRTVLSGDEFFLADHVIQGRRLLPAVVYLEMARAAAERSVGMSLFDGMEESRGRFWLKSVAWVRPLSVDGAPVEVQLRLAPEGEGELSFEVVTGVGADAAFHAQGRVGISAAAAAPVLDLEKLLGRCARAHYGAAECYRVFAGMGYEYGPAHRGIEELHVGTDEILARLRLPEGLAATRGELILHPALADAAVQATIGFALAERRDAGDAVQPAVPFELQSAEVFRPCQPTMWASIRRSDGSRDGNEIGTFDIDLCDDAGRLSARFRGWTTRVLKAAGPVAPARAVEPRLGEMLLAPAWEALPAGSEEAAAPAPAGRMAIVGGTDRRREELEELRPGARPLTLQPADSGEEMRRKIAAWGEIGHLVWMVPDHRPGAVDDESLLTAQREGVLFAFRLIKALLAEGYGDRPLAWTVITTGAQAIGADDPASPAHAGVHGLIGSMAKEQTGWSVRLADLPATPAADVADAAGDWPWQELLATAGDPHGNARAWRDRRWYRQHLVSCPPATVEMEAPYRPGGVYVVIGGGGGIGEVWSEALLRRMRVQIVWIGRRPQDAAIHARIERLAAIGPAPFYLSADATDREQLEGVRATIRQRFGRIDGVLHAAMVVQDHALMNMTEEEFTAGLAAKVDVAVRLAQVFGRERLDFVLFFSSINSFSKWPGQSNYSAGCVFEDAFAQRLAAAWPCRVRVVNWGYWSVGALASEKYRFLMARKGLGSIELPGAMQVLDRLLAGPLPQLVYLNASGARAFEGISVKSGERSPEALARDRERRLAEVAEGMGAPREAAASRLLAYLRLRVAEILGVDEASLDSRSRPFADALLGEFGMDSLSSNSLRNALRQEVGVDVPVQRIIGEKVHRIVDALYEQLLLKHVTQDSRPEEGEESETFVF